MSCLRPATPGFLVTLVATILLAVVSFNTPLIKSIFFLEASISVDGVNGTIRLGTLGYCLELSSNGTTCSSPSVGYNLDLNALLGDDTKVQIPSVVAKWITDALFIHVIALCLAAGSALFGLLAHVREMSMTCCSTCISGFAAVVALVAFVFDIVLFFLVKKRVQSLDGTASFGSGVWLTLAAWVLLFFAGCVYSCGRCCVSRRSRGDNDGRMDRSWMGRFAGNNDPSSQYAEQLRLDAVKAEADRKARQKEVGLPAFPDRDDAMRPLRAQSEEDVSTPYRDAAAVGVAGVGAGVRPGARRQGSSSTGTTTGPGQNYRGGYAQAPPGTRAVDEYYTPSPASPAPSSAHSRYPPNRQYSGRTNMTPPPMPGVGTTAAVGAGAGYVAANQAPGNHSQYASSAATYGHTNGGSSYHTAESAYQQYPSTYQAGGAGYSDPYSAGAAAMPSTDPYYSQGNTSAPYTFSTNDNSYGNAAYGYGTATYGNAAQSHNEERSYTLGGGGYGQNSVPNSSASPQPVTSGAIGGGAAYSSPYGTPGLSSSPPPMPAILAAGPAGPRNQTRATVVQPEREESYEDSPPGYESGIGGSTAPAVHVPAWGAKT